MNHYEGYHSARITQRIDWTAEQFTLRVTRTPLAFQAGQYTKLALPDEDDKLIARPYSLVNAPCQVASDHEFLIVAHHLGKLSPRLQSLNAGDEVWVSEKAYGDLIQPAIPEPTEDLWLLATGTGLGPFVSLLAEQQLTQKDIVLVHAVRYARDRVYADAIQALVKHYQGRLQYHTVVSREAVPGALSGRIPALIASGELQTKSGLTFTKARSFAMLCGNPEMIKETGRTLQELGLERFRQATGGNFIHERYW